MSEKMNNEERGVSDIIGREALIRQVVQEVASIDQHNKEVGSSTARASNFKLRRGNQCEVLLEDHFIPYSLYAAYYFRRGFRMRRYLFNKIILLFEIVIITLFKRRMLQML